MSLVVHVTEVVILGQVKNEQSVGDLMFVDVCTRRRYLSLSDNFL